MYYKFIKIFKISLKKFRFVRLLVYKFRTHYKRYHFFNFLKKDSIFIDIGANIGDISNYVSDRCLSKIYCYEPHPGAYKFLKKRFKYNNNINVYNYAVSDTSSVQDYYFHKNSPSELDIFYSEAGSLEKKKDNVDIKKKIKVKCLHINEILDKFQSIDCIKIDIEGHEYKILPSIIENRNKITKVICELHGKNHITNLKREVKNAYLTPQYEALISFLKKKNLYNNWFLEWD